MLHRELKDGSAYELVEVQAGETPRAAWERKLTFPVSFHL